MPSTKGRLSSKIWNHFTKIDGKGQCHYCSIKISVASGSSGNLKRHLKSHHRNVISRFYQDVDETTYDSPTESPTTGRAVATKALTECVVVENTEDGSFQIEEIADDGATEDTSKDNSVQKTPFQRRIYSRIWNHFTKADGRGKCHYCPANLSLASGSTGNLKRHLKSKHRDIMKGLRDDLRQRTFRSSSPSSKGEKRAAVKALIDRVVASDGESSFEEEENTADNQTTSTSNHSEMKCTPQRKVDYEKIQNNHRQFNQVAPPAAAALPRSSANQAIDECQYFGNFVATKLRKHEGSIRTAVENDIMEVFLKADRGFYNSQNTVIYQSETDTPVNPRNRPNVHFLISSDVLHGSSTETTDITNATVVQQVD